MLDGSGELPVLGMPGSLLLSMARARGRASAARGVPRPWLRRRRPAGAARPSRARWSTDPAQVASRAVELAASVDSVCVHGDSPGAVRTAAAVRRALEAAGLVVVTCWSSTA